MVTDTIKGIKEQWNDIKGENMRKEKMLELLREKGIKILERDGEIFEDKRENEDFPLDYYNHYSLLNYNGEWVFAFVTVERVSKKEITVEKTFKNQEEGVKYFFLNRLNWYFFDNYIIPNRKHHDFREGLDYERICSVMKIIGIPESYFSYGDIRNNNSVYYYDINNEWFFEYIGKSGKIIARCVHGFGEDEKDWFLSGSFNYSSLLFLLDKYEEELRTRNETEVSFDDIDRAVFLELNNIIL